MSEQDIYTKALTEQLAGQRNATADQLAHAVALLAVAKATIADLRQQLQPADAPATP